MPRLTTNPCLRFAVTTGTIIGPSIAIQDGRIEGPTITVLETGSAVTPTSMFQAASIGQPVTAMASLRRGAGPRAWNVFRASGSNIRLAA